MNPKKTKLIANWIVLKDKTKVNSVLELASYYRGFVNNFLLPY